MMLSVVVPTFCGERALPELHTRLSAVLDASVSDWELILVDDASGDDTAAVAHSLAASDARVRVLALHSNVGQHAATAIGLRHARGEVLVTMDDDLQQPPESIPALLAALRPGVDVVIARFPRPAHAWWRRLASAAVRRRMPDGARADALAITSFKAFRRDAAQRVLAALPREGRFYLATVLLATIPRSAIVNVDVRHHPRRHGRSGYGALALLHTAWLALRRERDGTVRS